MSEQVIIGKLSDLQTVQNVDKGTIHVVKDWDYRAAWSWLRLHHTRKIDARIKELQNIAADALYRSLRNEIPPMTPTVKALLKARHQALMGFLETEIQRIPVEKQRKLQFIRIGDNLVAVASLKHLLIPEQEIYAATQKLIEPLKLEEPEYSLFGKVVWLKEIAGSKLGLQVFGGDIRTRHAIKIVSIINVISCLNPVSWLNVNSLNSITGNISYKKRVLRIKAKEELEPRLCMGLKAARADLKNVEREIEQSKDVEVTDRGMRLVVSAMCLSYHLGVDTIKQVFAQYESEEKTIWGVSMALSYVAAHGTFRKGSDKTPQSLSTIAGATLMISHTKEMEQRSLNWLQEHIVEGKSKSIDELLKDVL